MAHVVDMKKAIELRSEARKRVREMHVMTVDGFEAIMYTVSLFIFIKNISGVDGLLDK